MGLTTTAILIHVEFKTPQTSEDVHEFQDLARSAGCEILSLMTTTRERPDSRTFIGKGLVADVAAQCQAEQADIVLFNHALSPGQVRHLEKACRCRVIDRTTLILDIFASRARTFEGKLQVELAQLQHLSSRLIRGWTHLERQKGGIGLRGPGETQLETDRRLIRQRIKQLQKRLEKVRSQRSQSRQFRQKSQCPTVALVGYTNAGKSTLFNYLTDAQVYVQDQLFATLDPTLRRVQIPTLGAVVLADTVGFIRHLPHDLVAAFQATLEETRDAQLLLHVVDASDPNHIDKIAEVEAVLKQIGAHQVPQVQVFNKIDKLDQVAHVDRDDTDQAYRVWLSAQQKTDPSALFSVIAERLSQAFVQAHLQLPPSKSQLRHELYQIGSILNESVTEQGDYLLEIKCPKAFYQQWQLSIFEISPET